MKELVFRKSSVRSHFQQIALLMLSLFINSDFCVYLLLLHSNPANYRFNLRPRDHHLSLPSVKKALFKNSFIMRVLYNYKGFV